MPDNMSFLPEDYLEKRVAKRTNLICLSLFAVVMVAIGAAELFGRAQDADVRRRLADVTQQYEDAARKLEQLDQLQQQKQQMIRKARVASVLVERVPRTLMLSELVNHMPATLSLLELNLDTATLKATAPPRSQLKARKDKKTKEAASADGEVEAPRTEIRLNLVGLSPTDVEVAQFITALSAHPMFKDVTLQYSEQTKVDEREMRKFSIGAVLNQDMDPRGIEPTRVARDLKMNPMSDELRITAGATVPSIPVVPAADSH